MLYIIKNNQFIPKAINNYLVDKTPGTEELRELFLIFRKPLCSISLVVHVVPFSINPPYKRWARVPVLIPSDSVTLASTKEEDYSSGGSVSSAKVHSTPSHTKVTTQKDTKEKKSLSASQYSF